MYQFTTARWVQAFTLLLATGAVARGQSVGSDRRTAEGRVYSSDPGDVDQTVRLSPEGRIYSTDPGNVDQTESRSPEGRRIAEPSGTAFQQEQARLAREKSRLDQEKSRLGRIETWMGQARAAIDEDSKAISGITRRVTVVSRSLSNEKDRLSQLRGAIPASEYNYSVDRYNDVLEQNNSLAREGMRRIDRRNELKAKLQMTQDRYESDLKVYRTRERQFQQDCRAVSAAKGAESGVKAGSDSGKLFFDDSATKDANRM
jgi:hypothetical protein